MKTYIILVSAIFMLMSNSFSGQMASASEIHKIFAANSNDAVLIQMKDNNPNATSFGCSGNNSNWAFALDLGHQHFNKFMSILLTAKSTNTPVIIGWEDNCNVFNNILTFDSIIIE